MSNCCGILVTWTSSAIHYTRIQLKECASFQTCILCSVIFLESPLIGIPGAQGGKMCCEIQHLKIRLLGKSFCNSKSSCSSLSEHTHLPVINTNLWAVTQNPVLPLNHLKFVHQKKKIPNKPTQNWRNK